MSIARAYAFCNRIASIATPASSLLVISASRARQEDPLTEPLVEGFLIPK